MQRGPHDASSWGRSDRGEGKDSLQRSGSERLRDAIRKRKISRGFMAGMAEHLLLGDIKCNCHTRFTRASVVQGARLTGGGRGDAAFDR